MEIVLTVAGIEWNKWVEYTIESSMLSLANAFSVKAYKTDLGITEIETGDSFKLIIDGDREMTGVIDEIISDGDDQSETIEVIGRDLGAYLVDNSATPKSYTNKTIGEIVEDQASEWFTDFSFATSERIRKVKIEPGESIADVIVRLCKKQQLIAWVEPDGTLKIDTPNYDQQPSYLCFLYEKNNDNRIYNNVMRWNVRRSIRDRYRTIKYYGTSGDTDVNYGLNTFVNYTVTDTDVVPEKTLIVIDSDLKNKSQAEKAAKMDKNRRNFEGLEINYTMAGHYGIDAKQNETKYAIDKIVQIEDERNNLSGNYYITRRRFSYGAQGRFTNLTIMQKDVWPG